MITSRRRVGVTVAPMSIWNVHAPQVIRWRLAGSDCIARLRSLSGDLRAYLAGR